MYAGRLQARRVGGATVPAAPVFLGSGAGSARTTGGHCSRSVLGERIERRRSALAIGVDAGRLAGPWHVRNARAAGDRPPTGGAGPSRACIHRFKDVTCGIHRTGAAVLSTPLYRGEAKRAGSRSPLSRIKAKNSWRVLSRSTERTCVSDDFITSVH
jgi:hypothetical protein